MTFFEHLLHDVVSQDEALRRHEAARWNQYLDQVEDISLDDPPIIGQLDDEDDES